MTRRFAAIGMAGFIWLFSGMPANGATADKRPSFRYYRTVPCCIRLARVADLSRLGFDFFSGGKLIELTRGRTVRIFNPGGSSRVESIGMDGFTRYYIDGDFPGNIQERHWFSGGKYCRRSNAKNYCYHFVRDNKKRLFRIEANSGFQILEPIRLERYVQWPS